MKRSLPFLLPLLLLLVTGALGQPARPPAPKPLVFTHVTVIDATGAPAKPDTTVVIADGRIAAIGPARGVRVPRGARAVDADPLRDIRNTRRIAAVVVNGRYLPQSELRKMLSEIEAVAGKR